MSSKFRVWFENGYPTAMSLLALAVGAAAFSKFPNLQPPLYAGAAKLFPSALNVGAISTGFLATSLSILLSLSGSRVFVKLRREGHDTRLIKFFSRALAVSFAWSLASAWMTALNFAAGGLWRHAAFLAWCFLSFCAVLCYYRASRLLTAVLMAQSQVLPLPSNGKRQDDERELEILA